MKRIYLLVVFSLSIFSSVCAQGNFGLYPIQCKYLGVDKYTVLDKAKYKFNYKLTCVVDTVKNKTVTNNLVLLVGTKYSKFFNNYPPHPEIKAGSKDVSIDESRGLGGTEVFKDLKNKKMNVTLRVWEPHSDVYTYEEKLPQQNWTIKTEFKTIHGYKCQKATTRYLGRNYVAWYTQEIPLSNGPWKLGGLPGMILEAYDTQHHYVFNCLGIEKMKKKEEIVKYTWHYVPKSRKEINTLIKRMHEDFFAYLSSVTSGSYSSTHSSSSDPCNPIERE